jgi:putative RecB family exonuclease
VTGLPAAIKDLSYSRLSSFESCPRQFWHAYVDKTPPDGYERVEGWMGSRVHEVLEWALKETLMRRVPDPVEVLARYDASWSEAWGPHVLITKDGYDEAHYHRVGRTCLKDYLDAEWPFLKHKPLMVEERVGFDVPLGGERARFLGFVDRVDEAEDGTIRVVDYKTGAWVPDFKDPADARQLALYWHALQGRFEAERKGLLVWHYLQKNQTRRVEATPQVVEPAVAWVQERTEQIQTQLMVNATKSGFPAKPSALCRWCSFGYTCQEYPFRAEAPMPKPPRGNARLTDF